ncbi:MAG: hypothetical protein ACR2QK_07170, partial [Acidimicrobiales bacterium]
MGVIAMNQTTVVTETATAAQALDRISVRPPYFDLGAMEELGDGIVVAEVAPAPTSDPEVGAIEAAQVARHLAILGSCAAALTRDDDARHHYLATRAHYTRLSNAPASVDGPLRAEAIASWSDRRSARALVKLSTESGQGLNLLDVEYTVLSPKMFLRFNPPIEAADGAESVVDHGGEPAAPTELPFEVDKIEDGVRVDCGPVPASLCAGHFPDYPAAPVAIVMGQLCRAAGLAMNRHLGCPDGRYRIEEGHVTASKLARAGQQLVLEARYRKPVRGGHQLRGVALADGEVVGELEV